MFGTVLYIAYYCVALFYIIFGVFLWSHPHIFEKHVQKCFPLLASFKYQRIANSVNLIIVGLSLLVIGYLLVRFTITGFFIALVLSGLEVYLGFFFYYREENDHFQAVLHVVLHTILVIIISFFILNHFSLEISTLHNQVASVFSSTMLWKQ